jgi:hypothetical protein
MHILDKVGSLSKIYEEFDKDVAELVKNHPVACALGCSHCCYNLIFVSVLEGLSMRSELDRLRFGADRSAAEKAEQVKNNIIKWIEDFDKWLLRCGIEKAQVIGKLDLDEASKNNWIKSSVQLQLRYILDYFGPCPLLKDDLCSLYKCRPIPCRPYWSTDANSCHRLYHVGKTDALIPQPVYQLQMKRKLAAEVVALEMQPDQTGMYELPLAYAIANPWQWLQNNSPLSSLWAENPDLKDR